jgi:hypothetical protein
MICNPLKYSVNYMRALYSVTMHFTHGVYSWISNDSRNKQLLFYYTALRH